MSEFREVTPAGHRRASASSLAAEHVLELLAQMNHENLRRSGINYVQGILAAPIIGLVQFIPLDAASAAAAQ